MRIRSNDLALGLVMAVTVSTSAFAHQGVETSAGFGAGFIHPLTGVDHLLLAAAIGLWAGLRHGHVIGTTPAALTAAIAVLVAVCLGLAHGYALGGVALVANAGVFHLAGLIAATAAILITAMGLGLAVHLQRAAPAIGWGLTLVGMLTF